MSKFGLFSTLLAVSILASGCVVGLGPDQAVVVRVIDGDTIEVVQNGVTYTERYIGIDTPETHGEVEPFGQEATEANRQLVEGKMVRLEKDVSETDRYGRLLRYVYVEVEGQEIMVNAELVRLGYALAATYPPDVKYAELFLQLEREAREAGRGLWGLNSALENNPTPVTSGTVAIDPRCSQFDAPGNDSQNKAEEFVCLVNNSGQTIDLGNWRLMDQTGFSGDEAYRYTLPTLTLAAGGQVRVHTGCGEATPTDLYWCKAGNAVWDNNGDTAYLFNAGGNLVAEYTY